eukprot:TRINITY_DN5348_c0_g1_i5.p1 TRINITY_DN5348_c0_g1~~TRINITY_DN5348_c0_g1_i5.p1  ORF type:complete len:145 (-),score=18.62 TRINITY_DN5348_c0_g1_i5:350-784(-)
MEISVSTDKVNVLVDDWIKIMLQSTPVEAKVRRLVEGDQYTKMLEKMDVSRPEGLGLGAELTHGRLTAAMTPGERAVRGSLKRDAHRHREEELAMALPRYAPKSEDQSKSKGKGRDVKVQRKLQITAKKVRHLFLLSMMSTCPN